MYRFVNNLYPWHFYICFTTEYISGIELPYDQISTVIETARFLSKSHYSSHGEFIIRRKFVRRYHAFDISRIDSLAYPSAFLSLFDEE